MAHIAAPDVARDRQDGFPDVTALEAPAALRVPLQAGEHLTATAALDALDVALRAVVVGGARRASVVAGAGKSVALAPDARAPDASARWCAHWAEPALVAAPYKQVAARFGEQSSAAAVPSALPVSAAQQPLAVPAGHSARAVPLAALLVLSFLPSALQVAVTVGGLEARAQPASSQLEPQASQARLETLVAEQLGPAVSLFAA